MEPGSLLANEWIMVVFYVFGVTVWGYLLKEKASRSLSESFLADRKVPGFIASISTVATNLNANDFLGMSGLAYGIGLVMIHLSLQTTLVIGVLSVILVTKLRNTNVFTLGQWLNQRYDKRVGNMYSIVWVFIWMPFALGLYIYAGALVLNTLVGWNLYVSIVVLTAVAATYTLMGGYTAVVATHIVQVFFMFFPLIFMVIMVWNKVGNPIELIKLLPEGKDYIWSSPTLFGHVSLLFFGHFFLVLSYWGCESQLIQRPLSTPDVDQAAISYIGTGFWYVVMVPCLIIFPGLAAIILFPGLKNNDHAMPMLLKTFLPPGLYGVAIVGLLSGLMSSCASMINAFCNMFTTDIYKGILSKDVGTPRLLKVSRIAGVIFTVTAIGTAVVYTRSRHGMLAACAEILGTIMPPFGAVTILGVLWKRCSSHGAFFGIVGGLGLSVIMVLLDFFGVLDSIADQTSFFRAMLTFLFATFIAVTVSLAKPGGKKPDESFETMQNTRLSSKTIALVVLLFILVISLYTFLTLLK